MDLDDEELKATRKLNGVAKESNIEEDIKRCEKLIEPQNANWIGISNQLAIAHIVDRIKELEENSIPKQKVKDKIEGLKKDYEDSKDENGETEYYYPDYTIRKLEELLEDK